MLPDLSQQAGDPRELWDAYFAANRPVPSAIRNRVLALHKAAKYEHAIAAIESAIIHGQSQPWMYEVLALTMQVAGRPRADVERVLLSQIDFVTADVPGMMIVAAYLTRFGADDAALRLYRQTSRLAPTRPEPYVLGLKLAQKQHDHETVAWAAAGILTYAWTEDHQTLHRQAEDALLEAKQQLLEAGKEEEAARLDATLAEARKRDLAIKLTWNGEGDLDLMIEEPAGTVCSFETPQSPGGGVLVHDGFGPNQDNCYEQYVCAFGMPGKYRVRIRHVAGGIVGKRARLTILRNLGTPHESVRTLTVEVGREDVDVWIALPRGRRADLAQVQPREVTRVPRRRGSLIQMVGELDAESQRAGQRFGQSRQQADLTQPFTQQGVGFQPVIAFLSEGASLTAMAVVSGDRRYVRITTIPRFNTITDVFTFSFINTGNPTGGGGGQGIGGGGNQPAGQGAGP